MHQALFSSVSPQAEVLNTNLVYEAYREWHRPLFCQLKRLKVWCYKPIMYSWSLAQHQPVRPSVHRLPWCTICSALDPGCPTIPADQIQDLGCLSLLIVISNQSVRTCATVLWCCCWSTCACVSAANLGKWRNANPITCGQRPFSQPGL